MRMSEGVEWGLHVCFALGVAGDEPVPVARLAEFHGIAAAYLQKHLQSLVSAGILESVPGRRGGFRLARQPDEIRLLDVVDAIEGSDPPFHCTEIRQRGPYPAPRALCRRPCQITRAMRRAEQAWRRELARQDRKSTRLNSSHVKISYAVFCLKKKKESV